ncbi:MAG: hypothetical protein ACI38A_08445 [Candidatus Ornithomonoglobus sp.]
MNRKTIIIILAVIAALMVLFIAVFAVYMGINGESLNSMETFSVTDEDKSLNENDANENSDDVSTEPNVIASNVVDSDAVASSTVDYSKYIGSFEILNGETDIILTITDIDASGGIFYLDTANIHRIMYRGPFNAVFNENGELSGIGYNDYGGVNESFTLIFNGDIITAVSENANWTFDINTDRIDMIDVTVDR